MNYKEEEHPLPYPTGSWKETYPKHLMAMETCFLENNYTIPPQYSVYMAGIVSRRFDKEYWKDVENQFLVEYPEEIENLIRRHHQYIGQNAPIVTFSRYNAEHHFMLNAIEESENLAFLRLRLPIRYFGIASTYSYYAGKKFLGDIFLYFSKNIEFLLKPLQVYLDKIYGKDEIPEPHPLIAEVWKKFSESFKDSESSIQRYSEYDTIVDLSRIIRGFRGAN